MINLSQPPQILSSLACVAALAAGPVKAEAPKTTSDFIKAVHNTAGSVKCVLTSTFGHVQKVEWALTVNPDLTSVAEYSLSTIYGHEKTQKITEVRIEDHDTNADFMPDERRTWAYDSSETKHPVVTIQPLDREEFLYPDMVRNAANACLLGK